MIGRRFQMRAVPVLLVVALLGFAAPMPARADFGRTASVTTPVTSATLAAPTAVTLPGGAVCLGTVTVNWTPSTSFVTGAVTGFLPSVLEYHVVLKNGAFVRNATVTGGGSATVDFSVGTLLGSFSATVQTFYRGWSSPVTASVTSRGCLA